MISESGKWAMFMHDTGKQIISQLLKLYLVFSTEM